MAKGEDKDKIKKTPGAGDPAIANARMGADEELTEEQLEELRRLQQKYLQLPPKLRHVEDEPETSLWLITFTDIMALMLTFFVLLYSMSTPKVEEWSNLTTGLNRSFSKFYSQKFQSGPQEAINIIRTEFSEALSLDYLQNLLQTAIEEDERLKGVVIIPQKGRLIISLPQNLLFDPGKVDVATSGQLALASIAEKLIRIPNRVEIIGHTDPEPVRNENSLHASNWHLSLARSAEVSRILSSVGYERPLTIRGLSSARYEELSGDFSEDELRGYARRVDIVILKDDGSQRLFMDAGSSG